MKVLAVDTSSDVGSVAAVCAGQLRAESAVAGRARHGEHLVAEVERVLEAAELELGDIELLGVGLGPGSFTGLRVGLATVKGLALSHDLPVVGVSSLRVLARGLGIGGDALAVPVVDAHRGEVFVAAFEAREAAGVSEVLAPFHDEPEAAARRLREAAPEQTLALCGSGLRRYGEQMQGILGPGTALAPPVWDVPRAAIAALEATAQLEREGPSDLTRLEPLYVRPSDAKLPDAGAPRQ